MNPSEREEVARRSFDIWNADDLERLADVWVRDGTIVAPEGWPEAGTFHSWDELMAQWHRIKDSWKEERVEVLSMEPAGDRILASIRWVVRGEASGAPLDVLMWMVFGFRGDRISRIDYFMDESAAHASLEKAG